MQVMKHFVSRRMMRLFLVGTGAALAAGGIAAYAGTPAFAAFSSVRSFAVSHVVSAVHASIDTFAPIAAIDGGEGMTETIPSAGESADSEALSETSDTAILSLPVMSEGHASSSRKEDAFSAPPVIIPHDDPQHSIPVILPSLPSQAPLHSSSSASILPSQQSSASSSSLSQSLCAFPSSSTFVGGSSSSIILINEIAWMGVPSAAVPSGANAANAEWMELRNVSRAALSLVGWTVADASGKIVVRFGAHDRIDGGGMLLLVRGSTTFPYAHVPQVAYNGVLKNSGDDIAVFDPSCAVSDAVFASTSGWPAGSNETKRTMERDEGGHGWHTSASPGGTPGVANSLPPPSHYAVTVAFAGVAGGSVTSAPQGLACTATGCQGTFATGDTVTFTPHPVAGTVFDGWSGACTGSGACTFVIAGDTSMTASFHVPQGDHSGEVSVAAPVALSSSSLSLSSSSVPASSSSPVDASSSASLPSAISASSSSPLNNAAGILIVAVQIAGDAASNDYARLYNPTASAVDMSGWKLRKRSPSGADYSLRTFPDGTSLAAGDYFLWANSQNGFAVSMDADVSSTETLAADNSIALFDASGNEVDALAWGSGTGHYGEGDPFPSNPDAGHVLSRVRSGNAFVDTHNNATDFNVE
jgi:hypothetical protein